MSLNIKKYSFNIGLFLFLGVVLFATFALANIVVETSIGVTATSGTNYYNVSQGVGYLYNISINNTNWGMDGNITMVVMGLQNGFNLNDSSNYTTSTGDTLVITGTNLVDRTLNWTNSTDGGYVINGTNVSSFFWFNATAYYYGYYNITVSVWNYTGPYQTNITVFVNDTVPPNVSAINSPVVGTNYSGSSMLLNATVNDSYLGIGVSSVYFNISNRTNSSFIAAVLTQTGGLYWNVTFDTTSKISGYWNITVFANDTSNNVNKTFSVLNVLFDNAAPSVSINSPVVGTNYSNTLLLNASVNDSFSDGSLGVGLSAVYFNVSNTTWSSLTVAVQLGTGSLYWNVSIATTDYPDGLWNITVLANDTFNNLNGSTSVLNVLFDNTPPAVSAINSPVVGTNYSGSGLVLNASVNDSYVATGLLGSTINSVYFNVSNTTWSNFTVANLTAAGSLYWNATTDTRGYPSGLWNVTVYANDTLNNLNDSTSVLNVLFDNTPPAVSINSPVAGTNYSSTLLLNASVNDSFATGLPGAGLNSVYFNISNMTNSTFLKASQLAAGSLYWNASFNTSGLLLDGTWNVTVHANDTLNNVNKTLFVDIKIDNTAPTISSFSCSPTSISVGSTITCACTPSSDLSNTTVSITGYDTNTVGTYTPLCTVSDTAGNVVSQRLSTSIVVNSAGGSSSGGGSGGTPSGTVSTQLTNTWVGMDSGKTYTYDIATNSIVLDKVDITPNVALSTVKVVIRQFDTMPTQVLRAPLGNVYKYNEIAREGILNSQIQKASVEFRVEKTWVDKLGAKENVKLVRYNNGVWEPLPTTYLGLTADGSKYKYKADVDGFSYFAITYQTPEQQTITSKSTTTASTDTTSASLSGAEQVAGEGVDANAVDTNAPENLYDQKQSSSSTWWPVVWALVALLVIGLVTYFVFKYKSEGGSSQYNYKSRKKRF